MNGYGNDSDQDQRLSNLHRSPHHRDVWRIRRKGSLESGDQALAFRIGLDCISQMKSSTSRLGRGLWVAERLVILRSVGTWRGHIEVASTRVNFPGSIYEYSP